MFFKKKHNTYNLAEIHSFSIHNGKDKYKSKKCGCFYCLKIYDSSLLKENEDQLCEGEDTWFCRYCGIDSLIFDNRCDVNEGLLRSMRKRWFNGCFPEDMTLLERKIFDSKLFKK